jgi:predicted RNA-binding Zn ribbon-like protein
MTLKLNTDKFKLIGGNRSVDFVNTVSGRFRNLSKKTGRDYLDFYYSDKLEDCADLLAWSLKDVLIDEKEAKRILQLAEKKPQEAEKVLKRALSLRKSVYRLFKSAIEGWKPEAVDLERLNREFSIARRHQQLTAAKTRFVFEWIDRSGALDQMLWQISESAAQMLANGDLSRLRQCGNDTCNWLFLDTSRNRSRQWCDMKDCGNLAKVRRFRAKQQVYDYG